MDSLWAKKSLQARAPDRGQKAKVHRCANLSRIAVELAEFGRYLFISGL
jgi:hypothetical protein